MTPQRRSGRGPHDPARRPIPRPASRIPQLLVVTTLTALTLTACFSGDSSGSSADSDERVDLAMLLPPRSGLTPFSDDAFKLSRWSTAETLIVLDEDGNAEPGLATEWDREDEHTWRFTIRQDVSFHDGTDLTAQAVADSLTAGTEATPLPRILDGVEMTIEADGDDVVVTTDDDDALVPQRLSSPQLSILAEAAYDGDTVDPVGHGTGPFELVDVDGTSSATLDRYEDYWGEQAAAAGIDVEFVPDGTARAAALRTGDADVAEAIPVGQAAQIDEDLIFEVPMPRTNTLYLNTDEGPFADPAVRAAAREAIDTATIIESAYEGRADEAAGLLGPAVPWAQEEREREEYQEILDQRAEPAEVDDVEITLGTFTDRSELPEVAVLLEQQLEEAGFVVEQDVREYQYIEADAIDGEFDAFILSRATVLDSGDPLAYMYSDFASTGSFNISQFSSDPVDEALNAAEPIEPGEDRQRAIMEAEARILAEDAAIPMLHERVIQGESANILDADRDPRERTLITGDTAITQD